MSRQTVVKLALLAVWFVLEVVPAWAHANYIGYSGAPGRGTCASSCHGNPGGTVVVSGFPQHYLPSQQYLITIRKLSGNSIRQFNASCRIGTGSQEAGMLTAGTGTATYSTTGEANGIHLSASNQDSATFLWTAPAAGTGSVRLYVAALQGSYTGLNTAIVAEASEAGPPAAADDPAPADHAIHIPPSVQLMWRAGAGAESHDVYFGETSPPTFVANVLETVLDLADDLFQPGTTYYWRVDERNAAGVTAGPLWQFTTWPLPESAANPQPPDGAADVPVVSLLTWTEGAHTETYDLEFGLTNPPPRVRTSAAGSPEYAPESGLLHDTVYYWRVTERNPFGEAVGPMWSFRTVAASAADDNEIAVPTELRLGPAYPNPFNATLTIPFSLPEADDISLSMYDILGQEVARIAQGRMTAGRHQITWDARGAGSGIYFAQLRTPARVATAKVVAVK